MTGNLLLIEFSFLTITKSLKSVLAKTFLTFLVTISSLREIAKTSVKSLDEFPNLNR